jgi:NAD(P)H-hydrate repair Nnr-like enzyme with NAD(P)H-hydrate epimerase domain
VLDPATGTSHSKVSEVPQDGDTTTLSTDVVSAVTGFGFASLPSTVAAIAGVQTSMLGKASDAGPRSVALDLVSGVDVDAGADHVLTTAYQYLLDMSELDPATGLPWTRTDLAAVIARLRLAA